MFPRNFCYWGPSYQTYGIHFRSMYSLCQQWVICPLQAREIFNNNISEKGFAHTSDISFCSFIWWNGKWSLSFWAQLSAAEHLEQVKTRGALSCCSAVSIQGHGNISFNFPFSSAWHSSSPTPTVGVLSPVPLCETQHGHNTALLSRLGEKLCCVWAVLSLAPVACRPRFIHVWTDGFTLAQEVERLDLLDHQQTLRIYIWNR